MIVYIITFTWTIFIFKFFCNKEKRTRERFFGFVVGLFFPVLIAGIRDSGVGTDTLVYSEYYLKESAHYSLMDIFDLSMDFEGVDRGYMLLNMFCGLFSDEVWIIFLVSSLFTFFFFFYGLENLRCQFNFKYWIFIFYFLFVYYNQSLNYMRQFCALALVFCAYSFYLKNKKLNYLILQILAYYFHSSSLLFVLIPALNELAKLKSKQLRFSIELGIILFFMMFLFFFWQILAFAVEHGLVISVYGDRYGGDTEYKPGQIDYSNVLLYILNLLLILHAKLKKVLNDNECHFAIMIHVIYGLLYSLMTISTYLFRISFYFGIIDMFYMVVILSAQRMPKIWSLSYFIVLIICWFYYFIYHNSCETYPYTSAILGIS